MGQIEPIFWLVPAAAVLALLFAWYFFRSMMRADEGTPRMREIALYVRRGAMSYLRQQYKVVLIAFIVLAAFFSVLAYGLGAVRLPYGGLLLGTGGLHRHAHRHVRLGAHCQCCAALPECGA